jgi:hypothetical protein
LGSNIKFDGIPRTGSKPTHGLPGKLPYGDFDCITKRRVGKISTAISLSAGLARRGQKTLLVDFDSQANSSKVMLENYPSIPIEETIHNTILKRQP